MPLFYCFALVLIWVGPKSIHRMHKAQTSLPHCQGIAHGLRAAVTE
jgi:hypothetical protein